MYLCSFRMFWYVAFSVLFALDLFAIFFAPLNYYFDFANLAGKKISLLPTKLSYFVCSATKSILFKHLQICFHCLIFQRASTITQRIQLIYDFISNAFFSSFQGFFNEHPQHLLCCIPFRITKFIFISYYLL